MKQKLFLIVVLLSNILLAQKNDSLKRVFLKNLMNERFKESIHEYKGKELPPFELTQLNGKKLNSQSLKGKPTVINFWFSSCQPCRDEIPLLNEIKSEFKNKVNFISLTFQTRNEVQEFLKTNNFNFIHLIESREYIKTFGSIGYPKTLILDKNLKIIEIKNKIPNDIENEKKNKSKFKSQLSNLLIELIKL
ncbi:TlpA family protein disulfide reductase [Tenacibaculum xiamenense]|uniref:TlpA family protein disulfide reductase n=1 Tax=Tenacibaculum xiamenense TaxID=1261553 RepID=UPI003892CCA1